MLKNQKEMIAKQQLQSPLKKTLHFMDSQENMNTQNRPAPQLIDAHTDSDDDLVYSLN
jgi:hypothetical protein